MIYQETIDYLFTRLPMFSRVGAAAYKADLTNTLRLCTVLGNPHKKFKSIHIAGTNGKGSTSHMLAAVLQSAGYKTGLYTSPHLKDFRERLKIDGEMVPEEFVVRFTEKIRPVIEEIEPSFFEITVAMMADWFAEQQVDIAVIETGLGGRLDSTNVILPEVSVITNIGFDHMNLLGDTLEKIAGEKAGIIKTGVSAVIGETNNTTAPVFTLKAATVNAPVVFADQLRYAADWHYQHHQLEVQVAASNTDERQTYQLDLPGFYQTRNLMTVLEAVHQLQLKGWDIQQTHIHSGLRQVKKLTGLHGRWELIHQHPAVILDVAHNADGIRQVVAMTELTQYRALHMVIGMVRDKDIQPALALLPKEASYYFTQANIPRALPADELAAQARELGLEGHIYPDVNTGLRAALEQAHKDDLVLVCGSVFVVGEVQL
ncbi:MAG: bifunctional folylpolyglutamate synthase/dihydrofolate synthase [Candidatus Pseudobacter hemicellulosilyticus]|uniref:Dihydrofolate synthase/folylpolyglutamate synthase n=1 Tax=Candidatus Pseudobacter hemicellulosilyticus TaxID=3121375 RepID=A0AAJ5WRL4_9BACT|nr:MAG: bifunctional folylpolyglutamate synthase/dihydrofolate synthase [Pseudobacter sp.]